MNDDGSQAIVGILGLALVVFVAWIFFRDVIGAGIAAGQRKNQPPSAPPRRNRQPPSPLLPPIDEDFPIPAIAMRPGKFVIYGVDRATKMDTTWHVAAESEANALVKADLEGITVTGIEREL